MYKVGDKVRIRITNSIHEIEEIISFDYGYITKTKIKLKGLCFWFVLGELKEFIEPIKKVSISKILRVGDKMKVKKTGEIGEIFKIKENNEIQLITKSSQLVNSFVYHISELEIVLPKYEPKLKYVSIDNFKVGDIVEKDDFLFEILEIKLSKFKLKPLSKDFYIEASCKELNKCVQLKAGERIRKTDFWYYNGFIKPTTCEGDIVMDSDSYFRVEKQTQEPEFDFIATWQKEREFYLIESKCGSLSRMDKPEFEEYCEKMDRLNVKYRIIE